ncbi:MAG: S-adenosylmethionine decarboxylase family protein [Dissulfurimicrobium sp.]
MTFNLAAANDNGLNQKQPGHELARQRMGAVMDTHLLAEIWQSPFATLADAKIIEKALNLLGKDATGIDGQDSYIFEVIVHQFSPYGVSGTAKMPDAHVIIHTWPENKYAAVDIYASDREKAYMVLEGIKNGLEAGYVQVTELRRGELLDIEDT